MKIQKRILALVLTVCLLVGGLPLSAVAADDSDFLIYGTELAKYKGSGGDVVIPDGITSIGDAFNGCTGLTSVTIPNSVTSIGDYAFYHCSNLTSINIPNGVTSINDYTFEGCKGLTSISIPSSVTSIGDRAFYGCGLTGITIPSSVTSIGQLTFSDCKGLTSITIPSSVTSISNSAFNGCTGLTSVIIPNSVTSIGDYVFWGCDSLTSITIPNSITSIGNNAFERCSGLTSITIRNGVKSIGNSAFNDCTGLTSVTIPDSVTSIGDNAFGQCRGLTSVTIPNSVKSIGNSAFSGCTGLTSVTIPNSVKSIGNSAFSGCTGLTSVTIANSVTSIGTGAFYYCTGLTSVIIPSGVKSIGDRAFSGCPYLKDIYYRGSEAQWKSIIGTDPVPSTATIHYNSTGPDDVASGTFAFTQLYYSGEIGQDLVLWLNLNVVTEDIDALIEQISWSVEKTNVAETVDLGKMIYEDGKVELSLNVKCKSAGVTTITGTLPDGTETSCTLTVGNASSTDKISLSNITDLSVGQSIPIFASFTGPVQDLECIWITSNPNVIAMNKDGSATVTQSLPPLDDISEENPLSICQHLFCVGSGEAIIKCMLSTGEWTEQKVVVWDVADNYTGNIMISNDYNVPSYRKSRKNAMIDELMEYHTAYLNAYENFENAVSQELNKHSKKGGFDIGQSFAEQAKKMMSEDTTNHYLTFLGKADKAVQQAAYEGLCHMMYTVGEQKSIDFKDVVKSDTFTTSNNIVKKIANGIGSYKGSYLDSTGKYTVEIDCGLYFGDKFGTMTVKSKKGNTSCRVAICSNMKESTAMCANYLNSLRELGEGAVYNVYNALAQDVFSCSLSSMAKKWTKAKIEKLFAPAMTQLDKVGLTPLLDIVVKSVDYYKKCSALLTPLNLDKGTDLADKAKKLDELLNYDFDTATKFKEKMTQKAYDQLKEVKDKLLEALRDYYLYGKLPEKEEGKKKWSIKSIFQCPIAITVKDEHGTVIGYIGEDDLWYSDEILIEKDGETKTVFSKDAPLQFSVKGTDDGMMNCVFEELNDNGATGRVIYYDMPLSDTDTYSVLLSTGKITSKDDVTIKENAGQTIDTEKYLSVTQNGRVNVEASVSDHDMGAVVGGGNYVEGSPVKLLAMPDDGYTFQGWYSENVLVSTNEFYEFTAREDICLNAMFAEIPENEINDYTITATANEGGSISPNGSVTVNEGDSITFTITPNSNYEIEDVQIDGVSGGKFTSHTFDNVTENHTISVRFSKKSGGSSDGTPDGGGSGGYPSVSYYSVKVDKAEHGSITTSSTSIYSGGTITLTVKPENGYMLDKITVKDSQNKSIELTEKDGKYSFKMPSCSVTVKAEFVPMGASSPSPAPSANPDATPTPDPSGSPSPTQAPEQSPSPRPWVNPFPDISNTAWYIKAVEYVATEGLMGGYPNGKFGPNNQISRAEFAQIMYNKAGRPNAGTSIFSDVKSGQWYAKAVNWAAAQKVVSGISNNLFAPERDITREELATMIWRYAKSPKPVKTTLDFTDANKVSNFAKEALLWANENGIISGKGNGVLDPKGNATRAEAAQMLMNYLKK